MAAIERGEVAGHITKILRAIPASIPRDHAVKPIPGGDAERIAVMHGRRPSAGPVALVVEVLGDEFRPWRDIPAQRRSDRIFLDARAEPVVAATVDAVHAG